MRAQRPALAGPSSLPGHEPGRSFCEARRPALAGPHTLRTGWPGGSLREARRPALAGPRKQDARRSDVVDIGCAGFCATSVRPGLRRIDPRQLVQDDLQSALDMVWYMTWPSWE